MSPHALSLAPLAVAACLSAFVLAAPLDAQPREVWGRALPPQPFEREALREVRVPEWVQGTVGVGYTLSVQDSEQRRRAAAAGVSISELGFVDPFYTYYESALLERRSPHVRPEKLSADVAEYRRLGIRILAVYPPTLQSEVYAKHPEWRRVAANTTAVPQVDLAKHPYGGMLCLLGPYADFMTDVLCEIVAKFDVDAFSFDGLHHGGACYCRHCRDAFRTDTGRELPDVNLDDPAFRRYQHWADRRLEDAVRRMQARLKALKPDVALVTWTTNAGRFGHLRDIPRNMPARLNLLFDAPDQEFWLDESNRGATVVPAVAAAYIWALTNHRVAFSEPYLMSHSSPYSKDSFPAHEVLRRMLLAAAYGVGPSIAVGQPQPLQEAVYDGLGEVQKRRRWLTHKAPEPWAAVVLSDNSRVFYGRRPDKVEERYLAHVFGAFRAAMESHLVFTLIADWSLNAADLARYKVLVLPNTACLDASQIAAVREFVRAGGGLVASADASLCDEFGDPRPDLGLGDVFGVSLQSPEAVGDAAGAPVAAVPDLDERRFAARRRSWRFRLEAGSVLDDPKLRARVGSEPVVFRGANAAVSPASSEARVEGSVEDPNAPCSPRLPAVVTHHFGKGRVVYFAAGLDAAYYLYPYPYQRLLLTSAIRWAAASPPPVEVEAPMCVHVNVLRQRLDGERLLVHLFNDVNTTAFHALPNDDVPLREETLPVHDIRVLLRGYLPKRVHLEPAGVELRVEERPEGLEVLVPRLDVHSIVVVELEGDGR